MKQIFIVITILVISLFIFGCVQQENGIPELPEPKSLGWEEEWKQNILELEKTNINKYYDEIFNRCVEEGPQEICQNIISNAREKGFRLLLDTTTSWHSNGTIIHEPKCQKDYRKVRYSTMFGHYSWCKPIPDEIVSKAQEIIDQHYVNLNQYIQLKDIGKTDDEYRVTYTFSMPDLYSEIYFYVDESGNLSEREIDSLVNCTKENIYCPPYNFNESEIISVFQKNDFVSCTLDYAGTVLLEEGLYAGYAYSIQYNCKENCVIPREIKGYDPECKTAHVNPFDGTVLKKNE